MFYVVIASLFAASGEGLLVVPTRETGQGWTARSKVRATLLHGIGVFLTDDADKLRYRTGRAIVIVEYTYLQLKRFPHDRRVVMEKRQARSDVASLATVLPGQDIEIVRVLLSDRGSHDPNHHLRLGRRWHCDYSGSASMLLTSPTGETISVSLDAARYIQVSAAAAPATRSVRWVGHVAEMIAHCSAQDPGEQRCAQRPGGRARDAPQADRAVYPTHESRIKDRRPCPGPG